jgi:N-acetylglucosamine transport system substrate-binding protein
MKRNFLASMVVMLVASILFTGNVLAQKKINIEVAVFFGASGLEWTENIAQNYETLHGNVKIKVWGDARVWEKLQPRFAAGNPPDLVAPGWGFNHWAAIYEGQAVPLDEALDSQAYGQDISWRETFIPGMLEPMEYQDHTWMIPPFRFVFMWWRDATIWEKYGWKVPETKDELLALIPKIEGIGMAPLVAEGTYDMYGPWGMLFPTVIRIGGLQAMVDAVNLVPGAWNSKPFIESARFWQEMALNHFPKGWRGMDHTQSQIEFLLGKIAMIAGHSILEHEMREVLPPKVKMRAMAIPSWGSGKPNAMATHMGSEQPSVFFVPSAGEHPEIATDLLKFITSLGQVQEILDGHGIPAIKGVTGRIPSDAARSAAKVADDAPATWDWRNTAGVWYPTLWEAVRNGWDRLTAGEVSPEEFAVMMETKAAEVRENDDIPKHVYKIGY